jgi:multicomponent K+:H+ antiporter subunit G
MDPIHPVLEAAIAAMLVIGGLFLAIGAIGLVRFPDFYMRLHAPTKASTLGVGGVLVASMLWHASQGQWSLRELLITLFVFVTAPVSAHLLALAALHQCTVSSTSPPPDIDRR